MKPNKTKIGKCGNSSVYFDWIDTECKDSQGCTRCAIQNGIPIVVSAVVRCGHVSQYAVPSDEHRILCGQPHVAHGRGYSWCRLHLFVGENIRQKKRLALFSGGIWAIGICVFLCLYFFFFGWILAEWNQSFFI